MRGLDMKLDSTDPHGSLCVLPADSQPCGQSGREGGTPCPRGQEKVSLRRCPSLPEKTQKRTQTRPHKWWGIQEDLRNSSKPTGPGGFFSSPSFFSGDLDTRLKVSISGPSSCSAAKTSPKGKMVEGPWPVRVPPVSAWACAETPLRHLSDRSGSALRQPVSWTARLRKTFAPTSGGGGLSAC